MNERQSLSRRLVHLTKNGRRLDLPIKTTEPLDRIQQVLYGLSFTLGALAGAVGDAVSLGFVAATEERVCAHLKDHLRQLPEDDRRSRLILQQMLEDEERHGENALAAGGHNFPTPVKNAMTALSQVMTKSSYYV